VTRWAVIGGVLLLTGLADALFWIQAEREYQALPKPLPSTWGSAELAQRFPRLAFSCRLFRHTLFPPPDAPPPPYSPIPLLGHKITGQALLALTLVFGGGGLTLVGLRGWFWTAGRFLLFALAAYVAFAYLFIHPLLLVATYRG